MLTMLNLYHPTQDVFPPSVSLANMDVPECMVSKTTGQLEAVKDYSNPINTEYHKQRLDRKSLLAKEWKISATAILDDIDWSCFIAKLCLEAGCTVKALKGLSIDHLDVFMGWERDFQTKHKGVVYFKADGDWIRARVREMVSVSCDIQEGIHVYVC